VVRTANPRRRMEQGWVTELVKPGRNGRQEVGAMDTLSRAERSERMGRVRSKDTKAELRVRRLVHAMGYRYGLHRRDLPGCPDMVFPRYRSVIFVHGCFWHRHGDCPLTRWPKSRLDFWVPKLESNRKRDLANQARLREQGWRVLVVWECQLSDAEALRQRVRRFLSGGEEP